MIGKYSPTVTAAYMSDRNWFNKYCVDPSGTYDPAGYDRYGYDSNDRDRADHFEHEYYDSDITGLYGDVQENWGFDGTKPAHNRGF